jgi:hypothetical protein
MPTISRYGCNWAVPSEGPDTDLKIEMACLRKGGQWIDAAGKTCGLGRYHHFMEMRKLIWPHLDNHRWLQLGYKEGLSTKVCTLLGSGGCGKTHTPASLLLMDYWCFPEDTIVLVSSTDFRGLDLRVWGQMKELFESGQEKFPWLAGHSIDNKRCISTDDLSEGQLRDLRKGIIGIPCVVNGKFVGLGKYIGIHQKRVRLCADEAQFMGSAFLDAFANLNMNPDFWAFILGNPSDIADPLGRAAEPKDGWGSYMAVEKTTVWDTKFYGGRCVNLIGLDSPNFDYPQNLPPKFPYLPHARQIEETKLSFGPDSDQYQSQCVGNMRTGMMLKRVVTRDMCKQFMAQESVIWKGKSLTRIYGVDAAYGGDRCVGGYIEFGEDIDGKVILNVAKPKIIPIRVARGEPEDQISNFVKDDCEALGIPPENMFHDATGRGSLGTSLARIWSAQTNPVEFGGSPTDRPVSLDFFVTDARTKQRRLLLCSEHYRNFVTELWYSIRYCIEAGQMRGLPEEVMDELCMREWFKTANNKIQVEPKSSKPGEKPGMKQRTGRSPDLADWLAICLEGARRRGFNISRLANQDDPGRNKDWFYEMARKQREARARHQLNYNA